MSTRTLLIALVATALTMPALAQTETAPSDQPAAPAAPAVMIEGSAPTASSVSRDRDTLSVDFPDEDIKTILRNVADLFELNLVVPDTLTGKTSIKLRDVTWRQIFHVVLAPAGYTYIEEGNIIKIVSNELLQQEPGTTEVFILNNAKAADIKPTIDGLIDAAGGGKIVIDARSNALVITERPSRMGRIRSIIDQLDKATDQVMIESKFVEVTDRDIRNIGVNWAGLDQLNVGVGKISQTFGRNRGQTFTDGSDTAKDTLDGSSSSNTSNAVTGSGSGTTNATLNGTTAGTTAGNSVTYVTGLAGGPGASIASTINLPSGTVSGLPATIAGSTGQANFTPGDPAGTPPTADSATALNTFSGSTTNGTSASTSNGTTGSTSNSLTGTIASGLTNSVNTAISQLTGLTNSGGTSRLASAVFTASDFNIIISALKSQNNTKIVSNPTVVTLNNTEATLNIGSEFPIPNYTYNQQTGQFEVSGFNYKAIGINLKVTPQVNARGVIKLALEPEVSQQNGTADFKGSSIPIIATRKVKTQISLMSGNTAGIGGLITSSKSHGGTKVPVLGDIPVLGRLFSSKSVRDEATNLLIFITAKTVSADGAPVEEVFDPRAIQALGMARDELPGNRAAKGTDLFAPSSTPAK